MKDSTLKVNNFDNHLLITVTDNSNLIDHIPAMVYRAVLAEQGIVLIKDRKNFKLPALRFGKHKNHVKQITATYDRDGNNNGVMAIGEKGSGKSMLAEEIGNWLINQDVPVILVDSYMSAQKLSLVIRAVGPCMVYFDEFGKVYDDDDKRGALLPLFSDTSFTGVMFIATGNDSEEFSNYLYNRPQRFRYCISYEPGIRDDVLEDILTTMQVNKELHLAFRKYVRREHRRLNMDSLLCVVRESAGVRDPNTLADRCEILNVPDFPRLQWNVSNVEILDEGDSEETGFGYELNHRTSNNLFTVREGLRVGFRGGWTDEDVNTMKELEYPTDVDKFEIVVKGVRTFRVTFTFDLGDHEVVSCVKGRGTEEDNAPQDSLAFGGYASSSSMLSAKHAQLS
ncbi:hypothetical protein D9M68_18440 [compost metagenome]